MDLKKKPGINVISADFMQQWNSALKNTERRLVELLRDETKKIISSLDAEFETSLKEAYPRNLKAARERVIKENDFILLKCYRDVETKNGGSLRVELAQRKGNLKEIRIGLSLSIFRIDREEKEKC